MGGDGRQVETAGSGEGRACTREGLANSSAAGPAAQDPYSPRGLSSVPGDREPSGRPPFPPWNERTTLSTSGKDRARTKCSRRYLDRLPHCPFNRPPLRLTVFSPPALSRQCRPGPRPSASSAATAHGLLFEGLVPARPAGASRRCGIARAPSTRRAWRAGVGSTGEAVARGGEERHEPLFIARSRLAPATQRRPPEPPRHYLRSAQGRAPTTRLPTGRPCRGSRQKKKPLGSVRGSAARSIHFRYACGFRETH